MDLYYTAIIFLAVFSMIIMIIIIQSNSFMQRTEKRRFAATYLLVVIAALAEWLGVTLNHASTTTRTLHIIIKFIELSISPVIPVMCVKAISPKSKVNILYAVYIFHTVLEMISMKTGLIFYVDVGNTYHHGKFYLIYTLSFIPGLLFLIAESFRVNKENQGQGSHILILSLTFLLSGIAFQTVDNSLRTDWICIAVFGLLFYIYYGELMQKIDATTSLLNRRCYDIFSTRLSKACDIFIIDVDKFKSINDTYGHLYGDKALNVIGDATKRVFSRYGFCFRIGGDEFCAVLLKGSYHPKELCALLDRKLDALREMDSRLPTVSVGYAHYEPEKMGYTDAFEAADNMMYRLKQKKKAVRK